jgi:hypothetical protein
LPFDGRRKLSTEAIKSSNSKIIGVLAAISLVILVLMPLVGIIIIVRNRHSLDLLSFKVKKGFLVENLNCDKLSCALFYQVFLIRRLVFGSLLFFLQDTPNL